MASESKQPGVMLYFDMRDGLNELSSEEKGMMLDAIFDYAEYGTVPVFSNATLRIAWGFIKAAIDRDSARYETVRQRRREAAQKRWNSNHSSEQKSDTTDGNHRDLRKQAQELKELLSDCD